VNLVDHEDGLTAPYPQQLILDRNRERQKSNVVKWGGRRGSEVARGWPGREEAVPPTYALVRSAGGDK
jgi:hypothetical protein